MITSIHLPTQEVLEYLLEYASILRLQKLYLVHLQNSTRHDYLALVQCDLIYTFFFNLFFSNLYVDLHVVLQVDIDICINHRQVVRFLPDMFGLVTYQSSTILYFSFCSQFYSNFKPKCLILFQGSGALGHQSV